MEISAGRPPLLPGAALFSSVAVAAFMALSSRSDAFSSQSDETMSIGWAAVRSGGASSSEMTFECTREDGRQKTEAGALGFPAVDGFGAGQDVEPETVDHRVQAAGDGIRIDIRI